jgi:hypothetical protein
MFLGAVPYQSEELADLLPASAQSIVGFGLLEQPSTIVLGQVDINDFQIDLLLNKWQDGPPRFLPQEGFLDEVLFGHDWWRDYTVDLNRACAYYPALAYVRTKAAFRWPSSEAHPKPGPRGDSPEIEHEPKTRLRAQCGYQIRGLSRKEHRRILTSCALPKLGLAEAAGTIAYLARMGKRVKGGATIYIHAITEWEHDLARLKSEFYEKLTNPSFVWPRSEE